MEPREQIEKKHRLAFVLPVFLVASLVFLLLNGCLLFQADLAREIERIRLTGEGVRSCSIDFMRVASYANGQSR